MRYLGLVGGGLALLGLFNLDWLVVGVGVFLVLISFLSDVFRKRGALTDDKVWSVYTVVNDLIRLIKTGVEASDTTLDNQKAKLAEGLFFLGFVDAASQAYNLTDKQFLELFDAVFTDLEYDFDEDFQSKLLLFHQSLATEHAAFPAIMQGGGLFNKFAQGNTGAPLVAPRLIAALAEDSSFPNSIEDL